MLAFVAVRKYLPEWATVRMGLLETATVQMDLLGSATVRGHALHCSKSRQIQAHCGENQQIRLHCGRSQQNLPHCGHSRQTRPSLRRKPANRTQTAGASSKSNPRIWQNPLKKRSWMCPLCVRSKHRNGCGEPHQSDRLKTAQRLLSERHIQSPY